MATNTMPVTSSAISSSSTLSLPRTNSASSSPSSYSSDAPARFGGTGLGGVSRLGPSPLADGRPNPQRQDSAPASTGTSSLSSAARVAADIVARPPQGASTAIGSLQPTRAAPPRPILSSNRAAPNPPTPGIITNGQPPRKPPTPPAGPIRNDSLGQVNPLPPLPQQKPAQADTPRSKTPEATRPAPSKSIPPSTSAGTTTTPAVKPLQPKKIQIADQEKPPPIKTAPSGGVKDAAAALESKPKDKEKEKRISTMTEVQIMEKLRSVVSDDDPKTLYSKIKKVGQGASGHVYVAKTLATGRKVRNDLPMM